MSVCKRCGADSAKKFIFIAATLRKEILLCEDCHLDELSEIQLENHKRENEDIDRLLDSLISKCSECGKTSIEYSEDVHSGCEVCHSLFSLKFSSTLEMPLVKEIKTILELEGKDELMYLIDNLNLIAVVLTARLNQAISSEDFELAAKIRDDIDFIKSNEEF